MPKFLVTAIATAKVKGTLTVEAETAEEALKKAREVSDNAMKPFSSSDYETKMWLDGHWVTQWDEVEDMDIVSIVGGNFDELLGRAEEATEL